MILIDNYDSFTYNIVEYLRILGVEPKVFKNDEITIKKLEKLNFNSIILSPGPSNPDNSGITLDVIDKFYKTKKILGICLGFQAIMQYFGAKVIKAKEPTHGITSEIYFDENDKLFFGFKQGFNATRYHSLTVTDIKYPILLTAKTKDNIPMGLKIDSYNVYGVQFHPEAILTENGINIIKNFIEI